MLAKQCLFDRGTLAIAMSVAFLGIIAISMGCGEDEDRLIIEDKPTFLRGVVRGSTSGLGIEGVGVFERFVLDGTVGYIPHDTTDSSGPYSAIAGVGIINSQIWKFEKKGYCSSFYLVPDDAKEIAKKELLLNIDLVKAPEGGVGN